MNPIIIIDAYISDTYKEDILKRCIDSYRKLNWDILLVSHSIISADIIKLVDYYIFDKENTFSDNHVWAYEIKNDIEIRTNIYKSHEYPIIRSIKSSISLADSMGYDFFVFTEFDNILSDLDLNRLVTYIEKVKNNDKKFLFIKPENATFGEIKGKYYETTIFAGYTNNFLKIFNEYFSLNLGDYNKYFSLRFPNCLEHFFYEMFLPYVHKSVILLGYAKEVFNNSSDINISSYAGIRCIILPSNTDEYFLYITTTNHIPYTIKVYFDKTLSETFELKRVEGDTNFKLIKLDNYCDINVDVYIDDEVKHNYQLQYDDMSMDIYKKNGIILFK